MIKILLFLFLVLVVNILSIFATSEVVKECDAGYYLHNSSNFELCLSCPNGTFNPYSSNKNASCFPCAVISYGVKTIIKNCTSTHDTYIVCKDNYTIEEVNSSKTCVPCPHPSMKGKGNGCYCGAGQYLYLNMSGPIQMCQKCPDGHYQSNNYHTSQGCPVCSKALTDIRSNQAILKPCSPTKDAEIGCKNNYMLDGRYNPVEMRCVLCKPCGDNEVIVKACTTTQDTECQPKKDGSTAFPDERTIARTTATTTVTTTGTSVATTTSTPKSDNNKIKNGSDSGLSAGAIAGIIVGGVLVLLLLLALLIFIIYRSGCYKRLPCFTNKPTTPAPTHNNNNESERPMLASNPREQVSDV